MRSTVKDFAWGPVRDDDDNDDAVSEDTCSAAKGTRARSNGYTLFQNSCAALSKLQAHGMNREHPSGAVCFGDRLFGKRIVESIGFFYPPSYFNLEKLL